VKRAVEALEAAWLKQDKAKLEAIALPQLIYSHSDVRIEEKEKFISLTELSGLAGGHGRQAAGVMAQNEVAL